jgi:hypothetical protein
MLKSVLLVNLVQMVVLHALQVLFVLLVLPPIILMVLLVPFVMKDVMDVQQPLVVLPVKLVTDHKPQLLLLLKQLVKNVLINVIHVLMLAVLLVQLVHS